ncbi:hypothetical protein GGR56DRAFT_583315 [Xylariaceae sp. FL0804]|nr:hypothetical protein GGR56DRAFT_583315 [Xylariaceae sp. FL0804]
MQHRTRMRVLLLPSFPFPFTMPHTRVLTSSVISPGPSPVLVPVPAPEESSAAPVAVAIAGRRNRTLVCAVYSPAAAALRCMKPTRPQHASATGRGGLVIVSGRARVSSQSLALIFFTSLFCFQKERKGGKSTWGWRKGSAAVCGRGGNASGEPFPPPLPGPLSKPEQKVNSIRRDKTGQGQKRG